MIILIDNYDSFTYNIVQVLGAQFKAPKSSDIKVYRNDKISASEVFDLHPKGIILSPGPSTPKESGICLDILQHYKQAYKNNDYQELPPLLGICLGHQAIGHVFDSPVIKAPEPIHGKLSAITHEGGSVFKDLPSPLQITRYHSLIIDKTNLSPDLEITATTNDNIIMGVKHKSLPLHGIQFHPESIATENGAQMLGNFKSICGII
jgi:anthranilate synthase/aminodeoxychorismate synthase-like glutamine amidotransferase